MSNETLCIALSGLRYRMRMQSPSFIAAAVMGCSVPAEMDNNNRRTSFDLRPVSYPAWSVATTIHLLFSASRQLEGSVHRPWNDGHTRVANGDVSLRRVRKNTPLTNPRWDTIQNVFYRKDEVYSLSWRISDLSEYLIAVGKNGGPIGKSMLLALQFEAHQLSDDPRRAESDAAGQARPRKAKNTPVHGGRDPARLPERKRIEWSHELF